MKAEIERLTAENANLKKARAPGLTLKVSQKGGVSLYGLGRFPVSLYLGHADQIRAFIDANSDNLSVKE